MKTTLIKAILQDEATSPVGEVVGDVPIKAIKISKNEILPLDAKVITAEEAEVITAARLIDIGEVIKDGGAVKDTREVIDHVGVGEEGIIPPEIEVEEMVNISVPDYDYVEPISTLDLESLFVKENPDDPESKVPDGYGWCIVDHDSDGVPILWTQTSDEMADLLEADSRIVIHQKLNGWPIEVINEENEILAKDAIIDLEVKK